MNTLAVVKVKNEIGIRLPGKILSGGDEKVLRLFEAPYSYVKIMNQLHPCKEELRYSTQKSNNEIEQLLGNEVKK